MNNKITFPRLATMLADKSGRSKRFSEDFLREFFSIISEQLESGESVKIKGLGTFRLSRVEPRKSVDVTTGQPMEISGHSKVVFVPAKEMAEAVNAPFEAFTSIEISDDADIQQLLSKEEEEESSAFSLQSSEDCKLGEAKIEFLLSRLAEIDCDNPLSHHIVKFGDHAFTKFGMENLSARTHFFRSMDTSSLTFRIISRTRCDTPVFVMRVIRI